MPNLTWVIAPLRVAERQPSWLIVGTTIRVKVASSRPHLIYATPGCLHPGHIHSEPKARWLDD
jgi:hypothetical protein